jgi:hypothetical protein
VNLENIWQVFHTQREEFCRLHTADVMKDHSGLSSPSPKRALAFAEALILCPSMEAAQARMQRDLEGARSFLIVADKVVSVSETGRSEPLTERLKRNTPFYLLASVVLDQLETYKSNPGNLWE